MTKGGSQHLQGLDKERTVHHTSPYQLQWIEPGEKTKTRQPNHNLRVKLLQLSLILITV